MAKEFQPGQVNVIDAAGIFNGAKSDYIAIVKLQTQAHKLAERFMRLAEEFGNKQEAFEQRGDTAMVQRAQDAAAKARDLMDQALSVRDQIAQIRLRHLMEIVLAMYVMLKQVKINRAAAEDLFGGEPGLAVLDDRILRAEDRWYNVYAPFFDISVTGEGGEVPTEEDLRYWGIPQWDEFRERIQGPILMWSPKECLERWKIEDAPRCAGPDYLYVLSLGNESYVAREAAYAHVELLAKDMRDNARAFIGAVGGALGDLAGIIIDPILQAAKRSFRMGGLLGWVVVGGIAFFGAKKMGWLK